MIWEVLKWAALVLAAGFVGYFGRHLAMTLIRRMGRVREAGPGAPVDRHENRDQDAKIEKKRIKQQVKLEKKRSVDPAERERP